MVRTRFAPSPTGYLHIGGVRSALFNWLFARHHGGQFVLRIDDTDQQRNVDEALAPILAGLKWLGIDWDEGPEVGGPHGPYHQSQRTEAYAAAVEQLLAGGFAYRDYARTEEIQAEREAAQAAKKSFVYSRRWMAETDAQAAQFEAEGRQAVVRLKTPHEGTLVIDDLVRGRVEFNWADEQDHVIQRADGSCLYHLATVVDEHDHQITHVIRAEEHLSNTPRQLFIAESLGYELPRFAHLPYVAEPGSKTKMSKRKIPKYIKNPEFAALYNHGLAIAERLGLETSEDVFNPVVTDFYEAVGYLPEAIVNYLLLLGWSLDDRTEDFSREAMIEAFTLERVNKAPASFDPNKLMAVQDRYMQRLSIDRKVELARPFLVGAGLLAASSDEAESDPRIAAVLEAAGDRIRVAGDILDFDDFFLADDALVYDEKAFAKRLGADEAQALLRDFATRLGDVDPFDAEATEACLRAFVEERGIKIGDLVHPIRLAVTGKAKGFGLFETLAILGRDAVLRRIELALTKAAAGT
ncbi:MAG: glutamate--tRNA ligase [Planctomycetota bacterium]|nr:MAG: glutamate--tRNA ligase [Planctomycetota bacterium]REK46064.1 MAG: glutamate--tRNA ligase [Planctomycetota bacterium]